MALTSFQEAAERAQKSSSFGGSTSSYARGNQQDLTRTSTTGQQSTVAAQQAVQAAADRAGSAAVDPRRTDRQLNGPVTLTGVPVKPTAGIVDYTAGKPSIRPALPVQKMRYPSDLPDNFQMIFHFGPYTNEVALRNWYVNHDLSVALPLPANLVDSTSLGYSTPNLGAIGGEFLGMLTKVAGSSDWLQSLRSEVNQAVRNPGKLASDVGRVIARRAIAGVSPTLGSALDLATGSTPNPHVAVSFTHVNLRTFTYTWKMSPNSPDESATLEEIIRTINSRILPAKDGSNFLLSFPNHCQILMQPMAIEKLFSFKPCVVESLAVNYAPSGIPSVFAGTNLPTEIEMTMTLKEVQIRTSEDYQRSSYAQD